MLECPLGTVILTERALQPLLVLATRQPSVVAIGTWYICPSSSRGPATPTGMGMYPITFSQQAPKTYTQKCSTHMLGLPHFSV